MEMVYGIIIGLCLILSGLYILAMYDSVKTLVIGSLFICIGIILNFIYMFDINKNETIMQTKSPAQVDTIINIHNNDKDTTYVYHFK